MRILGLFIALLISMALLSGSASERKTYTGVMPYKGSTLYITLEDTGKGKFLSVCDGDSCHRVVLYPEDK